MMYEDNFSTPQFSFDTPSFQESFHYDASTLQAFRTLSKTHPHPRPRAITSLDSFRRGYLPFKIRTSIEEQSDGIDPRMINGSDYTNGNSLDNSSNLAPTTLTDAAEAQPSHDLSDVDDILDAHEQRQQQQLHPSASPSPSFVPIALALERHESVRKRAKRAPPPQQPKSKRKVPSDTTKITAVTPDHKENVAYSRTRFSGPTFSTIPEPNDDSEYEDKPVGPSRKRRRGVPLQYKPDKDGEENQTSSTVHVNVPNIVEDDSGSPSTTTISVDNQNELNADSGSSTTASTAIVGVGKTREKVTITQLENGRWTCPRDDCYHTTDTPHDMSRHLATLAHRKKEFTCRKCKKTFTREDSLKRHKGTRCTGTCYR